MTNLSHSESRPLWLGCRHGGVSVAGQWRRQYRSFYSRPHINQTLPQIIHILQFCLVDLMLNCPRFCHQLMADECLAVCFTTLLRKASFQTLQTKITIYYNHYRDLSVSISWFVTGLLGWVSAPPTQSHFLQCVRALWPSVGTSCFSTAFSVFCSFNSCCLHEN